MNESVTQRDRGKRTEGRKAQRAKDRKTKAGVKILRFIDKF